MLKNFIIFFIVSIVAILFAGFFIKVDFTSAYGVGLIIGYWLITGGLAIFITYLPAGIFWLIKRKRMPGTYGLLWVSWLFLYALVFVAMYLSSLEKAV